MASKSTDCSIRVGIVGVGQFAQSFIPLFKAHPLVAQVVLCDLDADKLAKNCARHGIAETSPSLDNLLGTQVDAVALMTQNWLHAPQAIAALKAGKHVYSAVPTGISVDEIHTLVDVASQSDGVYMLGETSYYYPGVIYCRKRFRCGDFGHIVYGSAEYYHDFDHGLYDVYRARGGDRWREYAGTPPMHYPTHSASQIISVTGAHMTHVSCQGYVDQHPDGLYGRQANRWGNIYSDEMALFRMSDGSACRINEFRRVGHPGAVRMSLYGTEGSFEEALAGAVWATKAGVEPLDSLLACKGVPATGQGVRSGASDGTYRGVSAVHPTGRLPKSFLGLPNGHKGSHQFLVDDFCRSCAEGRLPPNHVWAAARYALPGIVAHESAEMGGALLEIPDYGDPPDHTPMPSATEP